MSAKRGHVRGAVQPSGGPRVGFTIDDVQHTSPAAYLVTTNISNPGALNGAQWFYTAVDGAAFARTAVLTQSPIAPVVLTPATSPISGSHNVLIYVEARGPTGELLGRSNTANFTG